MNIAALTEIEALELTIELWTWLGAEPDRPFKHLWPGWARLGAYTDLDHGPYMLFGCPCCEYAAQQYGGSGAVSEGIGMCLHCPLLHAWGMQDGETTQKPPRPCLAQNSPYKRWNDVRVYENPARQLEAQKIVQMAKNRLKELKS